MQIAGINAAFILHHNGGRKAFFRPGPRRNQAHSFRLKRRCQNSAFCGRVLNVEKALVKAGIELTLPAVTIQSGSHGCIEHGTPSDESRSISSSGVIFSVFT